jgi:hypothetical protein
MSEAVIAKTFILPQILFFCRKKLFFCKRNFELLTNEEEEEENKLRKLYLLCRLLGVMKLSA